MFTKIYQSYRKQASALFTSAFFVLISAATIFAQARPVPPPPPVAVRAEDYTWWYVSLFVLVLGLAGTIFWHLNNKKLKEAALQAKTKEKTNSDRELNSVDGNKELEWLRKNQKLVGKTNKRTTPKKKQPVISSPTAAVLETNDGAQEVLSSGTANAIQPSLPVFSIERLELARPFDALPISDDDDLMTAIEQAYDEFEEDEEVRDLAVRILTAFKKRNSVEALSQIALYDLSANLRSRAVSVLSEFDHESVFETILLSNADPTREVRAAAARSLTKLSFDRADAWTRIAETGEEGRITQAARAAIESGFVDMSFDRLVSKDSKQAYEAFTLMALLINAGETEKIFNALENHRDTNVRQAILHIIKVTKDQRAVDGLCALLEKNTLPIDLQEAVDRTIEEIGFVTA